MNAYVAHIDHLIRRGRELSAALADNPVDGATLAETRIWQRDCASTISNLSGGSKAHWLARRFSDAFLIRSRTHEPIGDAPTTDIVARIVTVLGDAAVSVSRIGDAAPASQPSSAGRVPRFDFVHNVELRPVLVEAFRDSRQAYDEGAFDRALILSCSILESLITDALEHAGVGPVAEWSFDERIGAAERAKLVRNSCARLPVVARQYRSILGEDGAARRGQEVSEREARVVAQVLQTVLRDLDPGR